MENPEGAFHVEALVDSYLQSQSGPAIMSDLQADAHNVMDGINGLLQQAQSMSSW